MATRLYQGTQSTGPSLVLRTERRACAAVLLAISREFGKSVDWLLTGLTHIEPKQIGGQRVSRIQITRNRGMVEYDAEPGALVFNISVASVWNGPRL